MGCPVSLSPGKAAVFLHNTMAKAMKKKAAMKAMKVMKKKAAMKAMKVMKKKAAMKAMKGIKNKNGKVVSKKASARTKKVLGAWLAAVKSARKALKITGFAAIKKGTPLYAKAKEFYSQ